MLSDVARHYAPKNTKKLLVPLTSFNLAEHTRSLEEKTKKQSKLGPLWLCGVVNFGLLKACQAKNKTKNLTNKIFAL